MPDEEVPKKKKIPLVDGRTKNAWGGILSKARSGDYDEDVITQIAVGALRQGVDPFTAVSVGLQESGLGTYDTNNAKENWGQVRVDKWSGDSGLQSAISSNKDLSPHAVAMNYVLSKKLAEGKNADEATNIQGYNGYRLFANNDIGAKTMYGIDLTKHPQGYDLKKDPRYGKSVIDLRENVVKKSPKLMEHITALKNNFEANKNNTFAGVTVAMVAGKDGNTNLQFMKDGQVVKEATVPALAFSKASKEEKSAVLRQIFQGK